MAIKSLSQLKDQYAADLELLLEVYHDQLLFVIWKIFPDWKAAERILQDVSNIIMQRREKLPDDEEQLFAVLVRICRMRTLESIPANDHNRD